MSEDMGDGSFEFAGISLRKEALLAWVFRLALLVMMLWAQGHFVSQSTYDADKVHADMQREEMLKTLQGIDNTLTRIDEKMKNDEARDRMISDHESRIRQLEKDDHAAPNR
jgi:hypothetical protein